MRSAVRRMTLATFIVLQDRILLLSLVALFRLELACATGGTEAGQKPETTTQQQGGMGGISSAESFAPVYDAEKRPITAGGFVTSGDGGF